MSHNFSRENPSMPLGMKNFLKSVFFLFLSTLDASQNSQDTLAKLC